MKKRFLTILLTLCMLFALVPAGALAETVYPTQNINVVFRYEPYWETGENGVISSREIGPDYGEFSAPTADALKEEESYEFAGWVSEYNDASTLYEGKFEYHDFYGANLFTENDTSVVFYAYYKKIEEPAPTNTIELVFRDGRYDVTGENGVVSSRTVGEGEYFPAAAGNEKDGYTFKGWSWGCTEDGTNGDASQMLVATDFSYVGLKVHWPNDNIVAVYAVYEKNEEPAPVKTIQLVFRDGRYDVTGDDGVVSSRTIDEDFGLTTVIPAPTAAVMKKDGYTFKGWSWESTEDGTNGDAGQMLAATDFSRYAIEKKWPYDDIVTLYAVYEKDAPATSKTLKVVFRDAPYWVTGDDGVLSSREIDPSYGEFPAPTADVLEVKDGYKFAGWVSEYNDASTLYEGKFEYNAMLEAGLFNAVNDETVTFYAYYVQEPDEPVKPDEPTKPVASPKPAEVQNAAAKVDEHPEIAQAIKDGTWGKTTAAVADPASTTASAAAAHVPQTSDSSNPILWGVAMLAALIALAAVVIVRRRSNKG